MYTNKINFNPDIKDICILSYNSRGFREDNQTVCKDLPKIAGNKFSIICNQENFLLKGNKYKIEQCLPDHQMYFKPATKVGLTGRPNNGMFVAIPNNCILKDTSSYNEDYKQKYTDHERILPARSQK